MKYENVHSINVSYRVCIYHIAIALCTDFNNNKRLFSQFYILTESWMDGNETQKWFREAMLEWELGTERCVLREKKKERERLSDRKKERNGKITTEIQAHTNNCIEMDGISTAAANGLNTIDKVNVRVCFQQMRLSFKKRIAISSAVYW